MDNVGQSVAGFVSPAAAPVHAGDVVSVVEAGQEAGAAAAAAAAEQPSSATDRYSSLNTSEHAAYFG
uniref:Uncharacterized protein n=1 Tax=Arundo donax TaxID=35708 RepID=A0A0A9CFF5_ARUDO